MLLPRVVLLATLLQVTVAALPVAGGARPAPAPITARTADTDRAPSAASAVEHAGVASALARAKPGSGPVTASSAETAERARKVLLLLLGTRRAADAR